MNCSVGNSLLAVITTQTSGFGADVDKGNETKGELSEKPQARRKMH